MQGKKASDTAVDNHTYKVFPNDLNTNGTLFGGLAMSILDRLSLVVAERHSGHSCVTVSVDALSFLAPAYLSDILICKASINRSWNSSMEIGTKIVAENPETGEKRHVVSAYFTFVALDDNHKPSKVPVVIPETPIQKRRFEEAGIRREERIRSTKERQKRRAQDDL